MITITYFVILTMAEQYLCLCCYLTLQHASCSGLHLSCPDDVCYGLLFYYLTVMMSILLMPCVWVCIMNAGPAFIPCCFLHTDMKQLKEKC